MTQTPKIADGLRFLARVVRKECKRLATTDQRLFGSDFASEQAGRLAAHLDLAGRFEAFLRGFGQLPEAGKLK